MTRIDLHRFYPGEPECSFVDLPDEIAGVLLSGEQDLEAVRRLTITIDLHKYYPHEPAGSFTEVPVRIAIELLTHERLEEADRRQMFRYNAYYSLDLNDGIESELLITALSPYDLVERSFIADELQSALRKLPEIQARRVRAYYFDGLSKAAIAEMEGVDERAIRLSIGCGLRNLKKYLKDLF